MERLEVPAHKPKARRTARISSSLIAAATFGLASVAAGNSLTWDSSGVNPASPVDGSGTWDTSTSLWSDGSTDNVWNNANGETPVFGNGGPAGTVTIDPNGVTAAGLTFNPASGPSPYTLTGGPITLAVGSNTISTPNSGVVPVIFSSLVGSGPTGGMGRFITFSGAITLSAAANSYVGRTTVTHSNVIIGSNGNQAYSAPFGGAGNMLTLDTSTLTANGSTTGASVSYQLPYNINITGNNTIFTGKNFTLGAQSSTLYTVQGNGSLTFNNNLSGTTSNISSSFSGAGIDAFTGTLHLSGYTIKLFPVTLGNFLGVPNGTLDNNAFASPQTPGGPFTFSLGALTGSGELGGGFTSATIATWSVGSLGLSTTYSGTIAGNAALSLTGGTLTLSAPSYNLNSYIGDTTVSAGNLIFQHSQTKTANVSVSSGQLQLAHNGGANIIRTGAVSVTGGCIDLTDNKLISTASPVGTWNGSAYTGISGLIALGRNGGSWNGSGIITSESNAGLTNALTTLAVASAGDVKGISGTQTASFGGQTVSPTDTLVMYTYAGDANLDGRISGDDYFRIDSGFASQSSQTPLLGYANGDFNYDGRINADDYFLIDRNYARQTTVFSGADPLEPPGVQAVPEPVGLGALVVLTATLGPGRKRRRLGAASC